MQDDNKKKSISQLRVRLAVTRMTDHFVEAAETKEEKRVITWTLAGWNTNKSQKLRNKDKLLLGCHGKRRTERLFYL